ncbi:MAG TPA: hypothetical protein VFQ39_02620 [Longimicrobium sp.]|nr:hypothetical protein [Longimicrobium sp.]
MRWTSAQRSVAAALLFLAAAVLAGVTPVETGVEYHLFGMVEGVFALLLAYLLTMRGAWPAPAGVAGWAATVYGTIATAQVLELLFPPPGMIEWVVVAGVAIAAWAVFAGGTPRRLIASLGSLAVLLAILKFSMIPVLWGIGPEKGSALGLGDAAEGVRRAFADYRPIRPAGQLVGFVAIACWALATRLLWPRGPADTVAVVDPPREERETPS